MQEENRQGIKHPIDRIKQECSRKKQLFKKYMHMELHYNITPSTKRPSICIQCRYIHLENLNHNGKLYPIVRAEHQDNNAKIHIFYYMHKQHHKKLKNTNWCSQACAILN